MKFIIKDSRYIKKRRNIIINYDFYVKNEKQLSKELQSQKPVFIIDQDEIKNGQIVLRKVNFLQIYNQFPIE